MKWAETSYEVQVKDWPPVSSDCKVRQSCASSETDTLCRESSSNVSILLSVPISALIGQSDGKANYLLHRHHIRTLARLQDERMNCDHDLANACGGVLPLISRKLEGIFLAKCMGLFWSGPPVDFEAL